VLLILLIFLWNKVAFLTSEGWQMKQITVINLKFIKNKLLFFLLFIIPSTLFSQILENNTPELENPVTVEYLKDNLPNYHPLLGSTAQLIRKLQHDIKNDEVVAKIENISHSGIQLSVVELDPPPHPLDKKIEGLKRLELIIPPSEINNQEKVIIKIKLSKI